MMPAPPRRQFGTPDRATIIVHGTGTEAAIRRGRTAREITLASDTARANAVLAAAKAAIALGAGGVRIR